MSIKVFTITVVFLMSLAAAACAPAAVPASSMADTKPTQAMMEETPAMTDAKPTDAMMEKKEDGMKDAQPTADAMMEKKDGGMMDAKPTEPAMADKGMPASGGGEKMAELPAWLKLPLTDARSGETFALADFSGKVVLLESIATWCPNCLQQQKQVKALHDALGMRDDLVAIGLGVDLKENASLLKSYVEKNGFDWKYAVATPELAKEISTLFGAQFLNPSATPMLIIDRQGKVIPLPFGIKSADALQKALEPHLAMK